MAGPLTKPRSVISMKIEQGALTRRLNVALGTADPLALESFLAQTLPSFGQGIEELRKEEAICRGIAEEVIGHWRARQPANGAVGSGGADTDGAAPLPADLLAKVDLDDEARHEQLRGLSAKQFVAVILALAGGGPLPGGAITGKVGEIAGKQAADTASAELSRMKTPRSGPPLVGHSRTDGWWLTEDGKEVARRTLVELV